MRYTGKLGALGMMLLLLIFGAGPAAAQGPADGTGFALQGDQCAPPGETVDLAGLIGDDGVFDETDEGYLRADIDNDGDIEIGVDDDLSGTLEEDEVLGTDLNDDGALTNEFVPGFGLAEEDDDVLDTDDEERAHDDDPLEEDEGTLDPNDEGYLADDLDDDGDSEIGVDEDNSGTLEEDEVRGTDINADGMLSDDEFVPGFGLIEEDDESGDKVIDASVEGFLCEDLDGDGDIEIGIDENANGTLEEDEVLGTDLNGDAALTEDELDGSAEEDTSTVGNGTGTVGGAEEDNGGDVSDDTTGGAGGSEEDNAGDGSGEGSGGEED